MFNRFATATRLALAAGITEAERNGDQHLNSDHLLLGLLHDPSSRATQAHGVDLARVRRTRTAMDREALAAVGIDVTDLADESPDDLDESVPELGHRPAWLRIRFTPATAEALRRTVKAAADRSSRTLEPEHLLLGLLDGQRPDPAAELLAALGVDAAAVRSRLAAA